MPEVTTPSAPLRSGNLVRLSSYPCHRSGHPALRATFQRDTLLCVWLVYGEIGKAFGLKELPGASKGYRAFKDWWEESDGEGALGRGEPGRYWGSQDGLERTSGTQGGRVPQTMPGRQPL